jgi:hypothetical protein
LNKKALKKALNGAFSYLDFSVRSIKNFDFPMKHRKIDQNAPFRDFFKAFGVN